MIAWWINRFFSFLSFYQRCKDQSLQSGGFFYFLHLEAQVKLSIGNWQQLWKLLEFKVEFLQPSCQTNSTNLSVFVLMLLQTQSRYLHNDCGCTCPPWRRVSFKADKAAEITARDPIIPAEAQPIKAHSKLATIN